MRSSIQYPAVYVNGTLARGRAAFGPRNGSRHHFRRSRSSSAEADDEVHVNGNIEEDQPLEERESSREAQDNNIPLLNSILPFTETQLSITDSLVTDLNHQLENLISELDRHPVSANHARDDIWTTRMTPEIMRSLARRMAVLLWFYHMGDAAELE